VTRVPLHPLWVAAAKENNTEISQPYARELARQVDELEAENERLRKALNEIRAAYIDPYDYQQLVTRIRETARKALED
jgi:predicted secreted Zn-dependent protease